MVAIPQINTISTGLDSVAWSKGNSFWDISAIQCRDFGFTAAHSMTSRYISQSNTNIELNIWNFSRVWKIYCLAGAWKWAPLTSTNGPDTHPLIDGELAAGRLSSCRGSAIKVRHSESGGLETGWGWDGCVDAGFDKTVLGQKVSHFKKEHPLSQSFAAIFPIDKTPTENLHWVSVIASLFVSQREKIKISAEQNFASATLNNLWCFYWSHFCIVALVIILVLTLFTCSFIHACFLLCVRQMTPFGVTAASTVLPRFNMMPPCRLSFHNV